MKYEVLLWINFFFKWIPGNIGCKIRNIIMPYECGRNVRIWEGVQIDKPSLLKIGNNVSINRGCVINAGGGIEIGNDTLIGPNVIIYSQNHNYINPNIPFYKQGYEKKRVIIENNVWIAANVILLPGIHIGKNTVVAAGSIVTRNIPSNVLVAGSPAKVIKNLKEG